MKEHKLSKIVLKCIPTKKKKKDDLGKLGLKALKEQ